MHRLIAVLTAVALSTAPVAAASRDETRALYDAMRMGDVIEVMQAEGVEYGADLRADLFPGRGGAAWPEVVAALYDASAMDAVVFERFHDELAEADIAPLLAFFRSELGARIVRLEIEARRAMVDEGVEAAAEERLDEMRRDGEDRLDLLDAFIEENDLVESNVVGAMNANYAFYLGLLDGGAFDTGMDEAQLLSDVWQQEPEIRSDTSDWVYSYLVLAYQPLSDADLVAYTEVSATAPGRALNRAIFDSFDEMYTTISRGLGQGAAQFMIGEEL